MSRWYRAYEGTVSDAKLHESALVAGVSRSVAIAAWHTLLEACAHSRSASYDTTPRRVAAILGEPVAQIDALFAAFDEIGLICNGELTAWSKRQFDTDSSTERSKRHREAKRNSHATTCNGDATLQQRDATAPDTDTDTDTSSLRSDVGADAPKKSAKPSPRKILETALSPEMADGVIEHRNRMRKPLTAIAAEGLAKALSSAPDPNAAARTMIERGWQGFKLEWLANDRQRAGPSQSQNPYLAIAAELGAFGRAADYDDITQAAGPYASEPSASRYAGDLSKPRGADAGNGRVLDLVAVRAVRG